MNRTTLGILIVIATIIIAGKSGNATGKSGGDWVFSKGATIIRLEYAVGEKWRDKLMANGWTRRADLNPANYKLTYENEL